ncbi:MAG: polysaccharide deacetylase family protein [Patescibacteria group bacterium]
MKLLYAIDFESWVFPQENKFLNLSVAERKKLDNEYALRSGYELLELLANKKQTLTFFVIGQIYDWYPKLISDIQSAGHEIAYHTYEHSILKDCQILEQELLKGQQFIRDFSIRGFQAPAIIFPSGGHAVLKKYGFDYSSSVYCANKKISNLDGVFEIPVSVLDYFVGQEKELRPPMPMQFSKLFQGVPFGSSYFTALLGGGLTAKLLRTMEKRGHQFANLFIHNWQIFQPRGAAFPDRKYLLSHPSYLPYTRNIKREFEYLLDNFEFCRFRDYLQNQ